MTEDDGLTPAEDAGDAAELRGDGPPRAAIAVALVLGVAAVLTIVVIALNRQPARGPVPVATLPAPQATSAECDTLLATAPEDLDGYRRTEILEPAPAGVLAWRNDAGQFPVIMRCGLDRPADFVVGAPMQVVSDVSWFRVADAGLVSWFVVDRPVYIALTLPENSGPGPIQQLSELIAEVLPVRPIEPGPPR